MGLFLGLVYCSLWYVSIFAVQNMGSYSYILQLLYVFLCISNIFFGYAGLFCPLLPLLFMSNKLYRQATDILFTFWQYYNTALLKYLCDCKIQVTGDAIKTNETSIIIINHRTRTDWNFIWPTLYQCVHGKFRILHSSKFVLKDIIRNIPGPGWVMQMSCFLYIKRLWEVDKKTFENYVKYVSDISYKHSIIIFPEGTDLTSNTKRSSDSFATKNNLQKYEYVLHPRTTGFAFLAHKMLDNKSLDAIYDVTLTYPDVVPQNERILLKGKFPKVVRVHLVRYDQNVLPQSEEGLKLFLEKKWQEKETILKELYSTGHFLHGKILEMDKPFELIFALIFWTSVPFFTLYCFIFFEKYRMIVIFNTIFLLVVNFLYGGFQNFEIAVYNYKKRFKIL